MPQNPDSTPLLRHSVGVTRRMPAIVRRPPPASTAALPVLRVTHSSRQMPLPFFQAGSRAG